MGCSGLTETKGGTMMSSRGDETHEEQRDITAKSGELERYCGRLVRLYRASPIRMPNSEGD
jgi:hypothetical protein